MGILVLRCFEDGQVAPQRKLGLESRLRHQEIMDISVLPSRAKPTSLTSTGSPFRIASFWGVSRGKFHSAKPSAARVALW